MSLLGFLTFMNFMNFHFNVIIVIKRIYLKTKTNKKGLTLPKSITKQQQKSIKLKDLQLNMIKIELSVIIQMMIVF